MTKAACRPERLKNKKSNLQERSGPRFGSSFKEDVLMGKGRGEFE